MKIKNQIVLLIAVLFSSSNLSQAQNYTDVFSKLVKEKLESQSPGGSVLVSKNGKNIYDYHYGKANLELDASTSAESVYRIASVSKQFTAIAILKLAEEGKLQISDNITKYINDYPTQGNTITIEHLLSHTSGIKDYLNIEGFNKTFQRNDMSPKELIDYFKDEPMDFKSGTKYNYSSSGYIILGHIIELISNQTYQDYMQEHIFEPLSLSNTSYDDTFSLIENRVSGYQKKGNNYVNPDFLSMTLPYAAGSLLSTTEDLFKWNQALATYKIVSAKTLNAAYSRYTLQSGKPSLHGYGWKIGNVQDVKAVKHSGGINGFVSQVLSIPEKDIYVAILTNSQNVEDIEDIASQLAAIALDKPYELNEIELSKSKMEYANGIYENEFGDQKHVRYEDKNLLLFDRGQTKNKLIPFKDNAFYIENTLITWSIKQDNEDIHLVENNTNRITNWKRIDATLKSIKPKKVKPNELKKYIGKYELGPNFYFEVKIDYNTLIGQIREDQKELIPIGNHQFIARDIDAKLTFNSDKKKIISLTLDQGREMVAKKVE